MESNERGPREDPPHQHRNHRQQIPFLGHGIHMDVQTVASHAVTHHLPQIVWTILNIHIGGIFQLPVLVDLQDLTNMSAPPQLLSHQLGLDGPATHRRRIIANL